MRPQEQLWRDFFYISYHCETIHPHTMKGKSAMDFLYCVRIAAGVDDAKERLLLIFSFCFFFIKWKRGVAWLLLKPSLWWTAASLQPLFMRGGFTFIKRPNPKNCQELLFSKKKVYCPRDQPKVMWRCCWSPAVDLFDKINFFLPPKPPAFNQLNDRPSVIMTAEKRLRWTPRAIVLRFASNSLGRSHHLNYKVTWSKGDETRKSEAIAFNS